MVSTELLWGPSSVTCQGECRWYRFGKQALIWRLSCTEVPRGRPLDPLFLVAINDINNFLDDNTLLFADDTTLQLGTFFKPIFDKNEIFNAISSMILSILVLWSIHYNNTHYFGLQSENNLVEVLLCCLLFGVIWNSYYLYFRGFAR